MRLAASIAGGIILAVIGIWFIGAAMLNAAASDASTATQQVLEHSQAEFQAATIAEQQRQAALRAEQDAEQQQAAAQAQELQHQQEVSIEKNQAWRDYYMAPKSCDSPKNWNEQVECGNHYMRAKRAFEAQWEASH